MVVIHSSCILTPVEFSLSSNSFCLTRQEQIVSQKQVNEHFNKI